MGVPGMVYLLKRRASWRTNIRLSDSKLVIDATDGLYWFVKGPLLSGHERQDRFGMSMIAYGRFLRQFFERLRVARVTPIVVYNGARLSEQSYGPMVAKTKHLERSAQIRMHLMNRRGPSGLDHTIVPDLASNVLKQIINELQLEAHQSTYEVYPLLVRLANENDCPVLTSHSDFILANVKRGFLLFEELNLTGHAAAAPEIASTNLYKHQLLLQSAGGASRLCGPALYCLNVLLRPDFSGRYNRLINALFRLPQSLLVPYDRTEFVRNHRPNRSPCAKRLEHILGSWPAELTDPENVRRVLERQATVTLGAGIEKDAALRDYDAIWLSFTDSNDQENIVALMPESLGRIVGLQDALTKRESTAPFLTDILMGQTNVDRLRIEDLSTFRSTYSLADPVKLQLMYRSRQSAGLKIFDRQRASMQHRTLKGGPTAAAAASASAQSGASNDIEAPDQMLYDTFLFPGQVSSPSNLRAYIRESKQSPGQLMKIALAFKDDADRQQTSASLCEQLIVVLLLIRFGAKIGFRDNYELPALRSSSSRSPPAQSPTAAGQQLQSALASKSQSGSLTDKLRPIDAKYRKIMPHFLNAVYNSIIYYSFKSGHLRDRMEEAELLRNDVDGGFYAKINLAVQEMDSNKVRPADTSNPHYLEIKHLIEQLNSSMHAYMELNSLYNHPGAVLRPADYYDGLHIFKVCSYLLQANKTNLLTIEPTDRLYSLLSDVLER